MTKSKAVATLEAALAAETNPDKRVEIASRLSKAMDAEGRERGRRARAKRQKKKADPAPTPFDMNAPYADDDELFEMDPPAAVISTPIRPDPLEVEQQIVEAEVEPEAPEPEKRPDGDSRVVSAIGPQEVFDYERGEWVYHAPSSSLGPSPFGWFPPLPDLIESNGYNSADGWSYEKRDPRTGQLYTTNQREENERQDRERLERDREEKLYGR